MQFLPKDTDGDVFFVRYSVLVGECVCDRERERWGNKKGLGVLCSIVQFINPHLQQSEKTEVSVLL